MTNRKVVAAVGVALFAFSLLGHRRRRAWRQRREAAAAAGAQKDGRHDDCVASGALPVDVNPSKLPAGWSVAPPVYFAAEQMAVLPLITPLENLALEEAESEQVGAVRVPGGAEKLPGGKGEKNAAGGVEGNAPGTRAFILCEGPNLAFMGKKLQRAEDVDATVRELVESCPLLRSAVGENAELQVEELPALSVGNERPVASAPLTHVVKAASCNDAGTNALLLGFHGPYICVVVLIGFPDQVPCSEDELQKEGRARSKSREETAEANTAPTHGDCTLQHAMEAVTTAMFTVPFKAEQSTMFDHSAGTFVFPGTPAGAHQGHYRVTLSDGDRTIVLRAPTDLTVRSLGSGLTTMIKGVSFEGYSEATGEKATLELPFDAVVSLTTAEKTLTAANPALAQGKSANQRNLMEQIIVVQALTAENRLTSQAQLTIVYTHPHLKVFFFVQPETGIVRDPILTDVPQILYFPLGPAADKPCMTILELPSFPPTWETTQKDDDELIHNVRFHFTEWDKEKVNCTVMELSGLKTVQFTETKEGVRCRSYVVPRKHTILVIRSEAPIDFFDRNPLLLQTFLDTLHVDA